MYNNLNQWHEQKSVATWNVSLDGLWKFSKVSWSIFFIYDLWGRIFWLKDEINRQLQTILSLQRCDYYSFAKIIDAISRREKEEEIDAILRKEKKRKSHFLLKWSKWKWK